MTNTTEPQIIHVLAAAVTIPVPPTHPSRHEDAFARRASADVAQRGDEVQLTESFIQSTRDRYNETWTDDLSDEAQVARWGAVRFGIGARPQWLTDELNEAARAAAEAKRIAGIRQARAYGRPAPDYENKVTR